MHEKEIGERTETLLEKAQRILVNADNCNNNLDSITGKLYGLDQNEITAERDFKNVNSVLKALDNVIIELQNRLIQLNNEL